ncbi:glutamate--tRNA ligase family protein [Methyloceanibacter stevinii]|uniref:glutamate--tRNA ligase family protein n=1 Tax=Methyloceanibacter stevinii TaxID=1774970 RepID=UPI000ABC4FCE|nr:glutamate--tRNA ligase family protein [Methyloceanibacter stevinii]
MAVQEAASTGFVTRFAPSPTGLLHLGHAYSALTAWEAAQAANGVCLLRIEDTDTGRVRREYEAAIYEDLSWLGLGWPEPVMRQSERQAAYVDALARLGALGLTYRAAAPAPISALHSQRRRKAPRRKRRAPRSIRARAGNDPCPTQDLRMRSASISAARSTLSREKH